MTKGGGVAVGALVQQREREQGQRRHDRGPDHQLESVVRLGDAGAYVADRPAGRAAEDQQQRERADRAAARQSDDPETERADRDAEGLTRRGQRERGEGEREYYLSLHHQRGEPGGHPRRHAEIQQGVLAGPGEQADQQQPAPGDLRARHEQAADRDGREPQGGEEQWREVGESGVDDGEVDAPNQYG